MSVAFAAPASDAAARERAIILLAALSWAVGLIHAAVAPPHWEEWPPFAACFALVAVAQVGWAAAFFRAPSRRLLAWGAVLSGALIAVWAISRTAGLPLGPDAGAPEAVGTADLAATAAEAVLVAAALGWRVPERVPRWLSPMTTAALLVAGLSLVMGCGHVH